MLYNICIDLGVVFVMLGLDQVYNELDSARSRVCRLMEMERLGVGVGEPLRDKILDVQNEVMDCINSGEDGDDGE